MNKSEHQEAYSIRYVLASTFQEGKSQPQPDILLSALRRIVKTFAACWHCTKPVLCNDAPEGHLPDEFGEDLNVNTRDVLSYAWRALKESRYADLLHRINIT